MKKSIIRVLTLFFLVILCAESYAQIEFVVQAPSMVEKGSQFKVSYKISAMAQRFIPSKISGFSVIAGPRSYPSHNIIIINGKTEQKTITSCDYVLEAVQEGEFTLPAITAIVSGKEYQSNTIKIKVVKGASANNNNVAGGSNRGQSTTQSQSLSSDDILLKMELSKNTAYVGEPVKATLKLYFRVGIAGYEISKLPKLTGFWTQVFEDKNKQKERESYNGKVYETYVLREYILFPQSEGKLKVDKTTVDVIAQIFVQGSQGNNPFDVIFGSQQVKNIKKELVTTDQYITVKEFPATKPAGFDGLVGNFTMNSSLSENSVMANKAITLKIRLSGSGNLPMAKEPTLELPSVFEKYDAKITNNYQTTPSNSSGDILYEIPFIPRSEGEYIINPVNITYFNLASKSFKTLSSEAFTIQVSKDTSTASSSSGSFSFSGMNKEDIKHLGSDIRFIKKSSSIGMKEESIIYTSLYWLGWLLLILLVIASDYVLRKVFSKRRNSKWQTDTKALKLIKIRLKKCKTFLDKGENSLFYQEVIIATYAFISDRFDIPTASLNKYNIRTYLERAGVKIESIEDIIAIIEECEFARYTTSKGASDIGTIYEKLIVLMGELQKK